MHMYNSTQPPSATHTRRLRLFFVQDKREGMPGYVSLDSLREIFRCLSPAPVLYKDDPSIANKARGLSG